MRFEKEKYKPRKMLSFLLIIIVFASMILVGCQRNTSETEQFVDKTSFIMGTIVNVRVYGPDRVVVANQVLDEIRRLENLLSNKIEDSEIYKINANAGIKPVKVSSDTFTVVKSAWEYAEKTGGLFDPSIGPLVALWGIGTKNARVPNETEIAEILPLVDYRKIIFDEIEKTIFLKETGMIIDVGGIGKGYAADRAIEIFKAKNVKTAFINIGGNTMTHGQKPDKSAWGIGIQDPRAARLEMMAIFQLPELAVVTSGDYERFFTQDNVRYHHILNPKTGYPAQTGLISASVFGEKSFDADALSTSVFLLGAEKGIELAQKMGYELMLITEDKEVIITGGYEDKLEIVNKGYSYEENEKG